MFLYILNLLFRYFLFLLYTFVIVKDTGVSSIIKEREASVTSKIVRHPQVLTHMPSDTQVQTKTHVHSEADLHLSPQASISSNDKAITVMD